MAPPAYHHQYPQDPMSAPRTDSPRKLTLSLAGRTHDQLAEIIEATVTLHNPRTRPSRSEIVEKAVAALHAKLCHPKGKQ